MKLGLFLLAAGHHAAGWRHPEAESGTENIDLVVRMTQAAERAKLDMVFFGDRLLTTPDSHPSMITRPDPLAMLAALSMVTTRIGLAATASTTYTEPFNLARTLATVDKLSRGRAAWNIVTTFADGSINFSRSRHPDHDERYEIAEEHVSVVKGLWRSWDPEPYVQDKQAGIYVDVSKMHALHHAGKHFSVAGPLNVTNSPQGHPVLIQAGSSGPGQALAARHAEVVFTAQQDLEAAQAFARGLKAQVREAGRDPRHCLIMPGLMPIIGRTEAEAHDKLAQLQSFTDQSNALAILNEQLGMDVSTFALDEPLPPLSTDIVVHSRSALLIKLARSRNLTLRQLYHLCASARGHQIVVGTAEQVAWHMIDWVQAGAADGFNIMPAYFPGGLEEFLSEVVPILQDRGEFRREYEADTLRGNLGLPLPR
ncbi:LLM class flavin-dependent oxidoreductase [Cupriavidus plantarum]|uniref:LLM class flavin-dependent oxidoreductase n=1 Tax=Cupriavidus plantarum TaxID=942865 RepID=UPI001B03FEBE|nr:LLM class flavin-dependent oxidoreductase [Cupriavidus plantarum]CAG2153629.1 Nitrilotriacetate monooxygenase component A [Cupriavidus plantarum]SMR86850.1 FMN-dependent oxidoreductase, nitrilotriacetate monooxygenase family [Cupriavidus plantarum]